MPAIFLLIALSLSLLTSADRTKHARKCPDWFPCGEHGPYKFPFTNKTDQSCGIFSVNCSEPRQTIRFKPGGYWYKIASIGQGRAVSIEEEALTPEELNLRSCESFEKFSFPSTSLFSNTFIRNNENSSLLNCSHSVGVDLSPELKLISCRNYDIYRWPHWETSFRFGSRCSGIQIPIDGHRSSTGHLFLTRNFTVDVFVSRDCDNCFHNKHGQCGNNSENEFICTSKKDDKLALKIGLGFGLPLGLVICSAAAFFLCWRYKRKREASKAIMRNISDACMNSDTELGRIYYGVSMFSYKDLQEATNNFDSEKELGDGGFGTVYHGVLKDGREVAVKRLYEHNYRRLEQFTNEIEILTRLRHRNLVSLYGCTSRRSRELLLVYEYVPNGTVADHLHGDRAQTSPLTWPVRLSIATETAAALAYLHASDTVHRDVKTNNILLDASFGVKVADFGLSRIFPGDVTHVSTAPQGTPGYVDPEYHQCYQLTSKSDVYSFGVVLIELISSMPAVDITRHRHEINLSSFAMAKIRRRAYTDLIDPSLGFESNEKTRAAVVAVAELAFRCLQHDNEARPTMREALEELRRIEAGNQEEFDSPAAVAAASPKCDEVGLLKGVRDEPPSPDTVTRIWHSGSSTTPNISS